MDRTDGFTISYYVGVTDQHLAGAADHVHHADSILAPGFELVKQRVRLYYLFLLLMEWAMIGVFVAQDLFFTCSGKSRLSRCTS